MALPWALIGRARLTPKAEQCHADRLDRRNAIADLETETKRALKPGQALVLSDDVVEGKLAAYELAIIHGIPEAWIAVTAGHVTRMGSGHGRALPLDAGGWYTFQGHEQPYEVAPGFAAAWKKARGLP